MWRAFRGTAVSSLFLNFLVTYLLLIREQGFDLSILPLMNFFRGIPALMWAGVRRVTGYLSQLFFSGFKDLTNLPDLQCR